MVYDDSEFRKREDDHKRLVNQRKADALAVKNKRFEDSFMLRYEGLTIVGCRRGGYDFCLDLKNIATGEVKKLEISIEGTDEPGAWIEFNGVQVTE